MRRWTLPVTLAAVLAATAAGCGSSSKSASPSTTSTVPASTTVPLHTGNDPTLRHNIILSRCGAGGGGWEAGGTAANATKHPVTYQLTVFFADAEGTVEGTGRTTVVVKAGKVADWTAQVAITNPDPKTTCVLSSVAG